MRIDQPPHEDGQRVLLHVGSWIAPDLRIYDLWHLFRGIRPCAHVGKALSRLALGRIAPESPPKRSRDYASRNVDVYDDGCVTAGISGVAGMLCRCSISHGD